MIIQYNIVVTILNKITNSTSTFNKEFETEITAATDGLLYNNYHILSKGVYILDMFEEEVDTYCKALDIEKSSVDVDEFEIVSLNDYAEVFFESSEENQLSLKPTIKCYVHPKNKELSAPELQGYAYDSNTIIWSWPNDEQYAHYLVAEAINPDSEEDKDKIIAQLPIGVTSYTETGLEPDTPYTRRLINYTDEQTSVPSASVTVLTETSKASQSLEEYTINKNYDFTTKDEERNIIEENLEAFHSGIGDENDLKVYKQMDADFYQKFKAYFEISGRRTQREKKYDQVGFNYKICLEAIEEVEEQEGEVTFDLEAYPREWIRLQQYMWSTLPVTVAAKLYGTILVTKTKDQNETVQMKLDKVEEVEVFLANPAFFTFIVDVSGSMAWELDKRGTPPPGEARWDYLKKAMTSAAETLINHANAAKVSCYFGIAVFSLTGATYLNYCDNLDTIKSYIDSIDKAAGKLGLDDNYTSWDAGCNAAVKLMENGVDTNGNVIKYNGQKAICQTNTIALFFSDGYPNSTNGVEYSKIKDDDWTDIVGKAISKSASILHNYAAETWCIDMYKGTGDHYEYGINYTQGLIIGAENNIASNGNCIKRISGSNASAIGALMKDMYASILEGTKKIVYRDDTVYSDEKQISYNIDSIIPMDIETDPITFEFNIQRTPVAYAKNEARAIITASDVLKPTKMSNTSIYDLFMPKINEKIAQGYNVIGDKNGFFIKNLYIKDSYIYGSEDTIDNSIFDASTYDYGRIGSVDVFTTLMHTDTTPFGDDIYYVDKEHYVMIEGYTDAIIYDGTRFIEAELNAYSHKSEIMISPSEDYTGILKNRRIDNLTYKSKGGQQKDINSEVEIIKKDKDIWVEGYEGLMKEGDHITLVGIEHEFIAHNDTFFQSPVLNYRFNLEDPDAKTPIYEILPKDNNGNIVDPESDFLHVVILNVYYARNVYVTNINEYIEIFGDVPEKEHGDPVYSTKENFYRWTKMEWKDSPIDNGWYIDNYIWFMSERKNKERPYYDELPGEGMETFYGRVNGRYEENNPSGKHDLRVDTPEFNIPTTVTDKHADSIKIYAVITEFYPDTALVSYKWEHPWNKKDSITQENGDYIYFNSDALTYKDVDYYDVITTINKQNQEIFDNKTTELQYEIEKPETIHEYTNYYLEVHTDNGDVLAMKYPEEIVFDENNLANIGVAFKGVVNATSKWSPRIHNGYYYLNQHEFYAYSEFEVEADFDTIEESSFKKAGGYISIDVQLRHKAKPAEHYSIVKDTRSELMQDETKFQWIDNKGLTLRPYIDGEYYKAYRTYTYISPVILFTNTLTTPGPLTLSYTLEDGSDLFNMKYRYYNIEEGAWSNWIPFVNGSAPGANSAGYQICCDISASTKETDLYVEDYLCCYLDWKDDQSEPNLTNIVTITDHMTTGPDNASGIYISKIFDYGYDKTQLELDIYESNYKDQVQLYIGYSNNKDSLLLENIRWENISNTKDKKRTGRFFRYKLVIPANEKVYWLHKQLYTVQTDSILPYITKVSMTGDYTPTDIVTNFTNTESFEVTKDGEWHKIFSNIMHMIGSDVLNRGYIENEIEYVKIVCTAPGVNIKYPDEINKQYPSQSALEGAIEAMTEQDKNIVIKNTPYIFVHQNADNPDGEIMHIIEITGTPQQYAPITVEDPDGHSYVELFNTDSFVQEESYEITEITKYLELNTNRYDPNYFKVYINDTQLSNDMYKVVNQLVIFNDAIIPQENDKTFVTIHYCILYSFISSIDRIKNKTVLYLHTYHNEEGFLGSFPEKCKVFFETSTKNNKFIANDLSLNPIYRTDYKGFIYLTDEHNDAYKINIYCNPKRIKSNGYDKVDINIEVLDIKDNPVISKPVYVDCKYGILINSDESSTSTHLTNIQKETDVNGVVHLLYESAYNSCIDTITVKVGLDDGTQLQESIEIINE